METMKTTTAFKTLIRCHVAIAVNTWKSVNWFVTKRSWLAVGLVVIIAFIISSANIISARAERDRATKQMYVMQDSLNTYKCIADGVFKR